MIFEINRVEDRIVFSGEIPIAEIQKLKLTWLDKATLFNACDASPADNLMVLSMLFHRHEASR